MIHLTKRGPHESSSELGQYIHDNRLNPNTVGNCFTYIDIDGMAYKRATGILRVVEHKYPGQGMGFAQREALTRLAECVAAMVERGKLAPGSGVYLVVWQPNDRSVETENVLSRDRAVLSLDEFHVFMRGEITEGI